MKTIHCPDCPREVVIDIEDARQRVIAFLHGFPPCARFANRAFDENLGLLQKVFDRERGNPGN